MKPPSRPLPARFSAAFLGAGAACLLAGCGPVEEKAGVPGGASSYVAPPAVQRRNPTPSPELHRWLQASDSVRSQLASLQEELAGLQKLHVENHFDDFLTLDPAGMEATQLCYLEHFLERGYFRIEREVLIKLLESRQARARSNSGGHSLDDTAGSTGDISSRLQSSLRRDETLVIDLEAAIARYRAPGDEPFQIPVLLTEDQVNVLRMKVSDLLSEERREIAALDARIAALQKP